MSGLVLAARRALLDDIRLKHGQLTADVVVAEASDPAHPFHGMFEWDDAAAAQEHRKSQARQLIRSVRIVTADKPSQRAYRAVPTATNGPREYVPVTEIAQDQRLTALVLQEMEFEWRRLRDRYGHFAEFVAMVSDDVDSMQDAADVDRDAA